MPLIAAASVDGVEMDGFLDDKYSLRTQRRCSLQRIAAHPGTLAGDRDLAACGEHGDQLASGRLARREH